MCIRDRGLDLGLLVDRQDQRILGGIHVEAHHVAHLVDKVRIAGQFP